MAIDIGDAIMTFTLDQSQGMAQLDQLGTDIPAKLQPAQAAINATSDAVSQMTEEMAVGQNGAVKLGEVMNLAGETSRESMYEARGEAELLGEMVGIRLPRHVRSFISELPGVGAAMSAAFQATAVLFVIEAIVKGVEKIAEWRDEARQLELAQENFGAAVARSFDSLDDKLLSAQIKADELANDHLGALQKELELIDHQSLAELEHQFELLAKAAESVFKGLETSWYTFNAGSKGAEAALTDFKAKYDLLLATGKDKEASDLLAGTKQSAEEVLALMVRFQNLKGSPNDSLEETNKKNAEALEIVNELKQRGAAYDEKAIKAQEILVTTLNAQANAQKEIADIAEQNKANKTTEEANRAAGDADRIFKAQADAQKRADEQEDKDEDDRRNKFIASFEEQEKEKIAATKQGSQARLDIIDAAIKDEEAHGFQDTAFYKSLQVQKVQATQARINQEQKAQLDADKEELTNAEQQSKREVESVKESSTEQEKAIQDLGKAKILSQSDTSNRLIAAYQNEKDRTLAVLNSLLHEEQALMEKAANQLAAAKLNPAITPEQLQQAETLLASLKNAVANTTTQIEKVKSDANAKQLAQDHSYYAQALSLAVAFGHQELAVQLANNHASLLQNQAQLQELKSRKDLTQAQQQQITVLEKLIAEEKKEEKQLESTAKQGLSAWTQFSQGFRDQAQQNVKTMQQMAAEMEQDVQSFGTVISGAFSSMISSQESFGAAMLHGTEKLIGQMAEQWGEFFLAKGIADIFFAPPLGAAELAAGAALMAIGGTLSGLGSGSGSSKSASAVPKGTAGPAANSPNANSQQPTQVLNVTHLASGGLVTGPTLAVIGDSSSGGSAREAVLPLDNGSVMKQIAQALASQMKDMSGQGEIHIRLESDIPYVAKVLSQGSRDGSIRLYATHARNGTALSK